MSHHFITVERNQDFRFCQKNALGVNFPFRSPTMFTMEVMPPQEAL